MADNAQAPGGVEGGGIGAGRDDPLRSFHFVVEVQGVAQGRFVECSSLGVRVNVIRQREGGNKAITHLIPGSVDYAPVTLRYGLTRSRELWDWMQKIVQGTVERRNVSIVMLQPDGSTEAMRWNLFDCWPSEWVSAALDASGNTLAIESMTLVFESLERA
ncbi:phage tail protein [Sphaerotilus sp.]|jgi:phage tail-like protein|uniref:phage tail protein n=1 Tax=Sphaerotilus sp. TaxID=2093942 RepID=UPI0026003B38|nr:phage tail protein [Sphaerotilus sp.]